MKTVHISQMSTLSWSLFSRALNVFLDFTANHRPQFWLLVREDMSSSRGGHYQTGEDLGRTVPPKGGFYWLGLSLILGGHQNVDAYFFRESGLKWRISTTKSEKWFRAQHFPLPSKKGLVGSQFLAQKGGHLHFWGGQLSHFVLPKREDKMC